MLISAKDLKYLKRVVFTLLYFLHPIQKGVVVFTSFMGEYNDNPKYISEKLHELYPDIRIVWVKSDRSHDPFPDYCETVPYNSVRHYKYLSCAQVVVDNYAGARFISAEDPPLLERLMMNLYWRRRKGQYSFSTWHGTPLKKIGNDTAVHWGKTPVNGSNSDAMLAGCDYTKSCLESAFPLGIPVKLYGTPRNDILFRNGTDVPALKERLGLPQDKKVILFAPTFRANDPEASGVSQMRSIDFARLFAALERQFGGDWCFVFRVHQAVQEDIDTAALAKTYGDRIIDGNIGDDMAEYLVCADALITDYSGSLFDFALVKRPCFLFAPDREHYETVERGLYMDYDALPFPKAYTAQELTERIDSFDSKTYQHDVERFLADIGNVEDGLAAERVVRDVVRFLKTGAKA